MYFYVKYYLKNKSAMQNTLSNFLNSQLIFSNLTKYFNLDFSLIQMLSEGIIS